MSPEEYVAAILDEAPPVTPATRDKLRTLLSGPVRVGDVVGGVLADMGAPQHVLDQIRSAS